MKNENPFSRNLLGALEIALFMHTGPQRFAGDYKTAKNSFLVPLLTLPVTLAMVLYAHPDAASLTSGDSQALVIVYALRTVLSLAAFMGLMYLMAVKLHCIERFAQFISACNWATLPVAALTLLPVFMLMNGSHDWNDIQPVIAVITLYSYACTGFAAASLMRMPWELAGFVAITAMAAHQTSLDVVKWAAVQTAYLLA